MKKTDAFNADKLMQLVDWLREQPPAALSGKTYKQISALSEQALGFAAPESTLHRIRTTPAYKVSWSTSKPHFDSKTVERELREKVERMDMELRTATLNIKRLQAAVNRLADCLLGGV